MDIGGQVVYLGVGEYEDGGLGEIFINVHKAGTALQATMSVAAIQFSVQVQYGVPLDVILAPWKASDFAPQGTVRGAEDLGVTSASSILNAVAQVIEKGYGPNSQGGG
jgi:ribonucleoside-diphosphate reductase alpha chain